MLRKLQIYIPSNTHTPPCPHTQVQSISADLRLTQDTIAVLSTEQHSMIHESFSILAEKCREEIQRVADSNGQLTNALANAETSLAALQDNYDKLRQKNEQLVSQKSNVSSEVSKLRSEISTLQDQKKMLEIQLVQTNTLTQQKDEQLQDLTEEKTKIEEKLNENERKWKNEFGRLEMEWEGRVAMATQAHELLLDSKEVLEAEKNDIEGKLTQVEFENTQLVLVQKELEGSVSQLESELGGLNEKYSVKKGLISTAQKDIARLLAEKALLKAEAKIHSKILQEKLSQVEAEKQREVDAVQSTSEELNQSLWKLEQERIAVHATLAKVVQKEGEIDQLTTKVATLGNEKQQIENEMQLLSEKHCQAQQDIQLLVDNEESRQLDNEKLKMTLMTEIELLKSKLKTLEEIRTPEGSKDKVNSAFQLVPQNRQTDQLLKQISALQQENKEKRRVSNSESLSSRLALVEMQSRLSGLEGENKKLQESTNGRQTVLNK